jgi:hypothetical protein
MRVTRLRGVEVRDGPRAGLREHGNAYNIFILVVTVFSLAIMAVLLLPMDEQTRVLLQAYDNVICAIFLADFAYNLSGSRPRSGYFIYQRGWLDLLGSVPTLGFFQLGPLLRLARLSRLARIGRLLGGRQGCPRRRPESVCDLITVLSAGMVRMPRLVLQFESASLTRTSRPGRCDLVGRRIHRRSAMTNTR